MTKSTVFVFAFLSEFLLAQVSIACPPHSPIARVDGVAFYSDKAGSVVDSTKLHERNDRVKPLRSFVTDVTTAIDSDDKNQQQCALELMTNWAKGDALLEEPSDFAGQREREEYSLPLMIVGLKLKTKGLNIQPLMKWLNNLARKNSQYFEKHSDLGNLYVWSGALAAANAFLNHDANSSDLQESKYYENKVWDYAIHSIRSDGFIDRELKREGKAQLYHVYSLSALLTILVFREALGESLKENEKAAIQRLVANVNDAFCDPSKIAKASGDHPQEKLSAPELDHAIFGAVAFGKDLTGKPAFGSCAPKNLPVGSPLVGGEFRKTVLAVSKH